MGTIDAARTIALIQKQVVRCGMCARLREYCADVAREKRKAYQDWTYWGKPVPGFGDVRAKILIVGLAPAAHGANRTGRMFTGDRSGDFLYAALHRTGLANQPESVRRDDGMKLNGVFITAAARCAPPGNKPQPSELKNCQTYLVRELEAMQPRVTFCLGGIAWNAALAALAELGEAIPKPRPAFGHGNELKLGITTVLGCYHVSQQNTFTGRLTEPMLDRVLVRARQIALKKQ